eukprot:UN00157
MRRKKRGGRDLCYFCLDVCCSDMKSCFVVFLFVFLYKMRGVCKLYMVLFVIFLKIRFWSIVCNNIHPII